MRWSSPRVCLIFIAAAPWAGAAGCVSAYRYERCAPCVHPALGEMHGDYGVVKLLYATDRKPTGGDTPAEFFSGDRTRVLHFGQCDVSIPRNHGRGRREEPGLGREREERHVALCGLSPAESKEAFVAELRQRLARSPRKEVFVFIHGFCNSFRDAARYTAQIAHDIALEGVAVCYSWPAQNSLLSYLIDTNNAEWSARYLADFLKLLADESGAERIHLMAHSMGTQVLTRAIKDFAAEQTRPAGSDGPRFDQIILAAADMDAEIFERDYLRFLLRCSKRVTIYVSVADWALGSSRLLHGYGRVGQIGAPNTDLSEMGRLDIIDATGCDRGLIGHVYYSDCPTILADLRKILNGESAADRGLTRRFFYKLDLAPAQRRTLRCEKNMKGPRRQ